VKYSRLASLEIRNPSKPFCSKVICFKASTLFKVLTQKENFMVVLA
jgi:hypothetical protein